ncbi:multiple C2 and transmembrane domain-containing protein isoform X4 [Lepeophtheirus salmonis]|uniref:multiple C2 and transmembrane domain-containing protein isoform X4 n=1 Tax=Lepeophtheirus salmonis TaxID=72036 RepID=UPI001AE95EE0|nr:multiple C2 and transmembrane domain-containing protein-like isoform X4 [Lepeophtheirus salmonis]
MSFFNFQTKILGTSKETPKDSEDKIKEGHEKSKNEELLEDGVDNSPLIDKDETTPSKKEEEEQEPLIKEGVQELSFEPSVPTEPIVCENIKESPTETGDDMTFFNKEKSTSKESNMEEKSSSMEGKEAVSNENTINSEDVILSTEERKKILRKYHFFKIDVVMLSGQNLLAMDRRGTSDPYVRCIQGAERLFQTKYIAKTVNPEWNETFICHTDNPFKPLMLQVYDHDVVGSDQFMGEAKVDLTNLQIKHPLDLTLPLKDGSNEDLIKKNKKRKPLGSIVLNLVMCPLTKEEMNEHIIALSSPRKTGMNRSLSTISNSSHSSKEGFHWAKLSKNTDGLNESNLQILKAEKLGKGTKASPVWNSVLNIVVVQARGLEIPSDAGDTCDPYCKLLFGKEKIRSKPMVGTVNPKWRESFNFNMYDDVENEMEVTLWHNVAGGKDSFLGRVKIDLTEFDIERNYNFWRNVSDGQGRVHFILSISATTNTDSPSNLVNWEEELDNLKKEWKDQYTITRSLKDIKDVGHCMVKVLRAQGIASSDLSGKSDPFCTVELCNVRYATHTEFRTLNPIWQKVYQFDVKDIHDVLEVTVYHDNKDHKYEFLGKVAIPLLKIRNNDRKWYTLKEKKLMTQAKGENPQIQLELFFVYNKFRASIRTFNPKQLKYIDKSDIKLKHSTFMRNVTRIKLVLANMKPELFISELKKILSWQCKWKSLLVLIGFELFVYYFEIWMLPVILIIPMIKNFAALSIMGGWQGGPELEIEEDDEEDVNSTTGADAEKKSIKERMQAMQEITLMIQNVLGIVAHVLESIGNVFNFSVPFLTWLLFVVLCIGTTLLYYVPLRYIIMIWGANKISKKYFRPDLVDNNELADFISHVPDNEMLKSYRELPSIEEKERKKLNSSRALIADSDII